MGLLGKVTTIASGGWLGVLRLVWPYLLGLAVLAFVVWRIYGWGYDNATNAAAKERGELIVERDSAISQREAAMLANANLAGSEKAARNALLVCQSENARLADAGLNAVQEAEQAQMKAEGALAEFKRKYGAKPQACSVALANLAKACPTLSDF